MIKIKQPPRDDKGNVIPHDHSDIAGNDAVIRRISKEHIVNLDNGKKRISSMAYQASTLNGGMSVDIKKFIENDKIDPMEWVSNPPWIGSVAFKVSDLRDMNYQVGYDPILPGNKMGLSPNPYHGEVWGSFTGGKKNRLKKMARWFVPIDGVDLY